LFTLALMASANGLAAHLKRAHALPDRSASASNLHHTYQIQ